MDMIQNHFEQISLSASAIAYLPFPPSKIFTNALLQPHDITALIRDTEIHEQALFSAATSDPTSTRKSLAPGISASEGALAGLKPGTAVSRILGSDLQRRIRRSERAKGDVDVDLLLEGAEKLCAAYPMPGVIERIRAMKVRHEKLASSISFYEGKLSDQAAEFERLSVPARGSSNTEDDMAISADLAVDTVAQAHSINIADEEAELVQLEKKRRGLEERVSGLERDLGGLRS